MGLAALVAATSCVPEPPAIASVSRATADPQALLRGLALDSSVADTLTRPLAGPVAALPKAAPPFVAVARSEADADRALQCLTAAVYYEARSESVDGQRAVAQVVLNRVRDRAFPASICGVVYQGSERSTGCQFSFTCDGSLWRPREASAWDRARLVAQAALAGAVYAPVGGATFYHADTVMPWWAASMTRITTIGAHLFYRWRGAMERALAFRQSYARAEPAQPVPRRPGLTDSAATLVSLDDGALVTVHRGPDATPRRMLVSAGVRIHRGALPDVEAPRSDGARIGEEDGAI
jgi:spore germination cell wall hydrolase CwlJ-like protein